MRRRRLLWEFIKIIIFFYAGLMMIWSSSLWVSQTTTVRLTFMVFSKTFFVQIL